jgi:hypothetical protein
MFPTGTPQGSAISTRLYVQLRRVVRVSVYLFEEVVHKVYGHRALAYRRTTRLIEALRTSPTAGTPGLLVSSSDTGRRSRPVSGCATAAGPVSTKPWRSSATCPCGQWVCGSAPMNTHSAFAGSRRRESAITALSHSARGTALPGRRGCHPRRR